MVSLTVSFAFEYWHIKSKADMSMHDVVKNHALRSPMKSMQNTNPSQGKVLVVLQ